MENLEQFRQEVRDWLSQAWPQEMRDKQARSALGKLSKDDLVGWQKRLAEKAKQAEKLFGIKAEQYKQAVVEATAEANAGVHVDDRDMDLGGGGSALMSLLPFLLCAGVLVAYVRSASGLHTRAAVRGRSSVSRCDPRVIRPGPM